MRTITLLLFPVSIGLIIGGAVAGNPMWIVGLILLIVDSVVGITIQYRIDNPSVFSKKEKDNDNSSFFTEDLNFAEIKAFETKVSKMMSNRNLKRIFTGEEIVSAIVNCKKAETILSERQFAIFFALVKKFALECKTLALNYEELVDVLLHLLSPLDLILPVTEFSDSVFVNCIIYEDPKKSTYREKGNQLLEKMIGELDDSYFDEWMKLQKEFYEEFYQL